MKANNIHLFFSLFLDLTFPAVVERDRRRRRGVVLPQKCVPHILLAVTPPRTESEASEMRRRHILSAAAPGRTRHSERRFHSRFLGLKCLASEFPCQKLCSSHPQADVYEVQKQNGRCSNSRARSASLSVISPNIAFQRVHCARAATPGRQAGRAGRQTGKRGKT